MASKLSSFRGFEELPAKIGEWDGSSSRNAADEARRAKEKKEKEIQDAVDAKLKEIEDSYCRFYLLEDKYENRVLKTYTASEKSLGKAAPSRNFSTQPLWRPSCWIRGCETMTDNIWADTVAQVWNRAEGREALKRTEALKSRGMCCLEKERHNKTHQFQAETKDGKPVKKVQYPPPFDIDRLSYPLQWGPS